jgi:hypothetical protein
MDGMELEYRRVEETHGWDEAGIQEATEGPHGWDGAGIQEARGTSWMGWSWNTGG